MWPRIEHHATISLCGLCGALKGHAAANLCRCFTFIAYYHANGRNAVTAADQRTAEFDRVGQGDLAGSHSSVTQCLAALGQELPIGELLLSAQQFACMFILDWR